MTAKVDTEAIKPAVVSPPVITPLVTALVLQGVVAGQHEPSEAARDAWLMAAVLEARVTANGQDALPTPHHGQRAPMLDLLRPLAEFDAADDLARTVAPPVRPNSAGSAHLR